MLTDRSITLNLLSDSVIATQRIFLARRKCTSFQSGKCHRIGWIGGNDDGRNNTARKSTNWNSRVDIQRDPRTTCRQGSPLNKKKLGVEKTWCSFSIIFSWTVGVRLNKKPSNGNFARSVAKWPVPSYFGPGHWFVDFSCGSRHQNGYIMS